MPLAYSARRGTSSWIDCGGWSGRATQRLLGDTISVSDDDWRAPSRLPGLDPRSRRHPYRPPGRRDLPADRVGARPANGRTCTPRPSSGRATSRQVPAALVSTCRSTSTPRRAARRRHSSSSMRPAPGMPIVEMSGGLRVPARLLPLARLLEVAIHHVDLDIGYEITDIDAPDRGVAAGMVLLPAAEPGRVPEGSADVRLRLHDGDRQRRRADRGQRQQSRICSAG